MVTTQSNISDLLPGFPVCEEAPTMHVRKRNGSLEPVDVNKIVRAVQRCSSGLSQVDAMRIASKTIGGLYDGATTRETGHHLHRYRRFVDRGRAAILEAGSTAVAGNHRQRGCRPEPALLLPVPRLRLPARHRQPGDRGVRQHTCPQAQSRNRRSAFRSIRILRPAHRLRPLSACAIPSRAK